ncbi:MAG: hypothetical protein Q4G08_09070, partial [Capnocytophaga sp.]|nr:hypothetical protein [Capnocytophaga sp.]
AAFFLSPQTFTKFGDFFVSLKPYFFFAKSRKKNQSRCFTKPLLPVRFFFWLLSNKPKVHFLKFIGNLPTKIKIFEEYGRKRLLINVSSI